MERMAEMIDDTMIKILVKQCGAKINMLDSDITLIVFKDFQLSAFAKACYAVGQDTQRESDAKLFDSFTFGVYSHPSPTIRANKEP